MARNLRRKPEGRTTVAIDIEIHNRAKRLAGATNRDLNKIISDALREYLPEQERAAARELLRDAEQLSATA